MTSLYSIDRQNAARILGVSVRTVDRYIASGQIRKVKNQGRTWLSNEDIKDMVSANKQTMSDSVASSFFSASAKDNVASQNVSSEPKVEVLDSERPQKKRGPDNNLNYKSLYNEAKEELEEKNKRLQQATYKIGQLESQVKSMIPQIEHEKQQKLLAQKVQNMESLFQNEVQKRETATKKLLGELRIKESELESEKFNKAIFAILLFLITFTLIFVIFLNYIT
jgi:hypothetical protein